MEIICVNLSIKIFWTKVGVELLFVIYQSFHDNFPMESGIFIREVEIEIIEESLNFYQKIEGDVSCVVWDASIVLAKYLEKKCNENRGYLKNCKIVELGAGLGCVGITASCLGATVVSTDLPDCIPFLELNINKNRNVWSKHGKLTTKSLIWGRDEELEFVPDMILLADCVYYEESINPLIKTLVNLAGPETEVILCQEMRESVKQQKCWRIFMDHLEEHFKIEHINLSEQHDEFCSSDIIILRLKKKKRMEYKKHELSTLKEGLPTSYGN
ncbi:hypothetical protein HHI36_017048 [Cryptolaemus montrouzieri]|uniref:Uncharacterized protein n=1 Tax=Cryptolaemus montrouzieri TaxID=559131 RepID=A0ABD2NLB7_9CUCU